MRCRNQADMFWLFLSVYPFSPNAVVRQSDTKVVTNANMSLVRSTRGVMATVEAQLRAERDPNSKFTSLFSRTATDRIPPGSVLLVETYTNSSKTSFSTFAGILIAIRRRGLSSSFVLRNIVSKLGVEIRFNMYSPLLKDVKIVQRASAGKNDKTGKLRRARRAKLYYLRGDDRKLSGIGKSIAALRSREEAEKTSRVGRRPSIRDRR